MSLDDCSFCGDPAEGNYSVHRDGFGEGPEVDLCDACGGELEPTLEEIWEKTRLRVGDVVRPALEGAPKGLEGIVTHYMGESVSNPWSGVWFNGEHFQGLESADLERVYPEAP